MQFKTKKLKTELTLAETLKHLREAHSLTLADLAQALRLQLRYLKNLERGNYTKLPAQVYIKGFLRRYAEFFKVSFDNLWQLYTREKTVLAKLEKKPDRDLKTFGHLPSLKPLLTPKILIISLASLTFLCLLIYFGYQLSFLIKPPVIILDSPSDDFITWDNNLILQGRVSPNAQLVVNNQPIKTSKDGIFKYSIALAQGMNLIKLVAENPFGKTTEILRRVVLK